METLRHGDDLGLYRLRLLDHGQDLLIEVLAQHIAHRLLRLVDKERLVAFQLCGNVVLAEESTEDILFFQRGLALPVAFQKLIFIK